MKFSDIYEFIKYLNDNNLKVDETVDIEIKPLDKKSKAKDKKIDEVVFTQLRGHPTLSVVSEETATTDTLLVDSYQAIPNLCGVGRIVWRGREVITNICEQDGKAYASFDTKLSESDIPNKKYLLVEKRALPQYNRYDIVLTEETQNSWLKKAHS